MSLLTALGCDSQRPLPELATWADTVEAAELALIGEVDGPSEYLFGRIAAVAADRSGTIYVADGLGSTVRAYTSSGSYLGTVGTEGEGPTEFLYLRDLGFDPSDNLHVWGAFRLSVLRRSSGSEYADSLIRTVAIAGIDSPPGIRAKTDGERYFIPGYRYENYLIRGHYYVVVDSLGHAVDTVAVPAFPDTEVSGRATYPIDESGRGRGVEGVNRAPFEAAPSWDIGRNGHVVAAAGGPYELLEFGLSGDTVQTISYAFPAVGIPRLEAQDSARAFKQRIDSIPVAIDRMRGMSAMARRGDMPSLLPHIVGVHVDSDNNIWIRRWPRSGLKETVFDVLSSAGLPIAVVRIPAELLSVPVPWVSRALVVGVVRDPDDHVDRVAVYSLSGN